MTMTDTSQYHVEGRMTDGGKFDDSVTGRVAACLKAQGIEEDGGSASVTGPDGEIVDHWDGYRIGLTWEAALVFGGLVSPAPREKQLEHVAHTMGNEFAMVHAALGLPEDAVMDAEVMVEAIKRLKQSADRWDALLASDRIRMIGSAGIMRPEPNNSAHFGMEIWTHYGRSLNPEQLDSMAKGNEQGRDWLTKYADIAMARQQARRESEDQQNESKEQP
jgi:hypothetical protein